MSAAAALGISFQIMWYKRDAVEMLDSPSKVNFEWSFQPISLATKYLSGIELFLVNQGAHSCKWFLRFYTCLMLLVNAFSNDGMYFNIVFQDFSTLMTSASNADGRDAADDDDDQGRTNVMSRAISCINAFVYCLGIHLTFFLSTLSTKWKDIWSILLEIEKQIILDANVFRKIRRVAFWGLLEVVLVRKSILSPAFVFRNLKIFHFFLYYEIEFCLWNLVGFDLCSSLE